MGRYFFSIYFFIGEILFFKPVAYASLPEFGVLSSAGEGHIIFSLSDGSPIKKRYCLVELRIKEEKKIHWISHPLEELYVRRQPEYILNFDDKNMVVASVGIDKEKQRVTQIHIYEKPAQKLTLVTQSPCGEASLIKIYRDRIQFTCKSKKKTFSLEEGEIKKLFSQFVPQEGVAFEKAIYEVSGHSWTFKIVETDYYFKDNLHLLKNGRTVKKYKAKDFLKCFEYETLQGSQDKFSK